MAFPVVVALVCTLIWLTSSCPVSCLQCWSSCQPRAVLYAMENYRSVLSPCFPDLPQPNTECEWQLRASPGRVVEVEVFYLLQYGPDSCPPDSLVLYDGDDSSSPEMARLCGNDFRYIRYCSEGPHMTLRLRSASFSFVINYRQVSPHMARQCHWRSNSSLPHTPRIPHFSPSPAHTLSHTTPPSSKAAYSSLSDVTVGIICVSALLLLVCFVAVCIKVLPSRRSSPHRQPRPASGRASLFTITPASSDPFPGSPTVPGSRRSHFPSRARSASSWWRSILNLQGSEDMCYSTTSLVHTGPRSADSDLSVFRGQDFPEPPPAYDDAPPPYPAEECGRSSSSREAVEGRAAEALEAPPSYSEAVRLCLPSDPAAAEGQTVRCVREMDHV